MINRFITIFIILTGLLLVHVAMAGESKVTRDGIVYVGETNLDLSDCNVLSGDEIAWWESGNPQGPPTARARIADARRFTIDPAIFKGHAGTWYGLIGKKVAFTVEEPFLQVDLVENGIDTEPDSIKRGNLVSFKISTNLAGLSKRPGSPGAIVSLNLTGPNETEFHTLSSKRTNEFNLDKVLVYTSPYDSGVVWDTSDEKEFPDGEYTLSGITNVNGIHDAYSESGATYTEKRTYRLGKTEVKPSETGTEKEEKSDTKNDELSAESTGTVTPTETQEGKSSKKVKKTEETTEETTPVVSGEPTPEEKTSTKVNNTQVPDETETGEETTVPTTIATIEATPEPTEEPTAKITLRPTRTPFPRPPAPGASPTPASPLPPVIIPIALSVGLLIAGRHRP